MPQGLPEGLVTTKVDVRGGLESVDPIDVEDIARLWKAYHTNRAIFAEDVGRRLENFFWRIWGSHRLLHSITGTMVATIFSKISEGGYIRTTPTQSPRSSRTLGTFPRSQQTEKPRIMSRPVPSMPSENISNLPKDDDDAGDAEETETEAKIAAKKKLPPRPPPILKKPKSISPPDSLPVPHLADRVHQSSAAEHTISTSPRNSTRQQVQPKSLGKTARFNTDEVKSSHYLPVSSEVDVNIDEEITEPQGKSKSSSTRRKAPVVASTGASKRRPVMRQRSSQTSSNNTPVAAPSQTGVEPVRDASTTIDTPAKGSSYPPHSKQQTVFRTERPEEQRELETERTSTASASKNSRVDRTETSIEPGGRTISSHTSFTSLPSILKKSPSAAAPATYQASGLMDMGQPIGLGTGRGSFGYPTSENRSSIDIQTSDNNTQPLPRTKSQLTMLLQRDRAASGSQ